MLDVQLETFICVVEYGNFSKAAEKLYLSPTAVMKRINKLEDRIGVILFNRTAQGMLLTPAGSVFYSKIKPVVHHMYNAVESARKEESKKSITINIGNMSGFPELFYENCWGKIVEECREFSINFMHYDFNEQRLRQMFEDVGGKIDMILEYYDPVYAETMGLKTMHLMYTQSSCFVFSEYPLAEKTYITLEDLVEKRVMMPESKVSGELSEYYIRLKEELVQYFGAKVEKFSVFDTDIYNDLHKENIVFVMPANSRKVNPYLKTIPLKWKEDFSFGLCYKAVPGTKVTRFIERIKAIK